MALACSHILFAQPTQPNQPATDPANAQAPYLRFPTLPPFHLLKLDSATYLTKEDVKKNRKTIVMYFSPDCEHCKHEIESFFGRLGQIQGYRDRDGNVSAVWGDEGVQYALPHL